MYTATEQHKITPILLNEAVYTVSNVTSLEVLSLHANLVGKQMLVNTKKNLNKNTPAKTARVK